MADKGKDREPEIYATGNPEPIDKPKELPPEIDAERQAIAQELSEYIAAHPTDRALNHNSIRPLLDASHVLAFLSSFTDESVKMTGLRDPGEPFPLHYKGAAHVLTELFGPYCNGPELADVVADCVKKYLATYPQPDTGQQDKGNKFTDLQLFAADAETTPTIGDINRAESALMDAQTAATAADISDLAQSALDAMPNIDELNQAADTLEQAIERLSPTVKPPKYGIMNDKLNNEILRGYHRKSYIDGQLSFLLDVNEAGKKESRDVPVLFSTTYLGPEIKTSTELTIEDMQDLDAIFTIILNLEMQGVQAPFNISPDDIWRKENGITDNKVTPTPKQREALCKRIEMRRFTETFIDCSAEIKDHNLSFKDERLKAGTVKDNFYHAAEGKFLTEKGRTVDGYSFFSEPIVASYNYEKGNILLAEYSLLDTRDKTGNEGNTGGFRRYLMQQILLMYSHKRDNTTILYDTVYKETSIAKPQNKKEAKEDRDKMLSILESWKERTPKFILDYHQTKKGRAYSGIEIELNPDYHLANIKEISEKQ